MKSNTDQGSFLSLESFIALMPAHIYQKNCNGVYLKCSDLQAHVFGYKNGMEIVGKTDYDLLDKECADSIRANDLRVICTGEMLAIEEHGKLPNGTEVVYLSKKIPLCNEQGESIGILGFSTDITELKKNEENNIIDLKEKAKKSEHGIKTYYENLIALMPGNVYWMDCNNVFLGCNDQQAKLAGFQSRHEIVGKTNYDMPWKEQAEKINDLNNEVINSGIPYIAEENAEMLYNNKLKKGIFLSQKIPLFDDTGKVIGLLGVSIDITDRKKAEEYRIKYEAAEKIIKFTNLVAGSIAHELRTPLAGISSYMDLLETLPDSTKQTQAEKDAFLKTAVTAIKSTIKATTHVINDMLLKVRTFATGQVPQKSFEEISITSDIENLLDTFPFEKNTQDLVKVSYKARFKYIGDKVLTNHVLGNLLKNALHAIVEADKGDITIETSSEGDFNFLTFRDTASGIPSAFISKIFDQFETKKTTHGGTGLGLAFCKMVMDYYGGSITCNSKEGEYTEFVLSFPKLQSLKNT